ncbi:MAG TPA: alpha/beta fold hydrolase [Terracidiphilus sp.]|nr:alpha/beta fold hydrolase [Terracidiphilus sp.]
MRIGNVVLTCLLFTGMVAAQRPVVIPMAGHEQIQGDLYGAGSRAIVLAHGGRFNKESWAPQARVLADAGFTVLAINFRGDRLNPDGSPSAEGSDADNAADVVAAVRYLRANGAKTVFAIGGSLGGDAVGNADVLLNPGEMERVVFLGSEGGDHPEQLHGRKLYIVARNDTSGSGLRLPGIQDHFARAPQPKKLVIVDGSAHAQYLFGSDQGPQVMHEILAFLSAK